MNSIEIENLTMDFRRDRVLHGITHSFEKGMIHGIVGNNGSGKTVMFKCICGFLNPTGGKVIVEGKRIGRDRDFPESIGIIIEAPGFLPQFNGLKNLGMLASIRGKLTLTEIAEVIRRVGLDPTSRKPVGKYSLGMRQRLGIAQAIMEKPRILILDEPTNGLDKYGVVEIRELIRSLRDPERTILIASHNVADIDELCDTVCEMDAGVLTKIR